MYILNTVIPYTKYLRKYDKEKENDRKKHVPKFIGMNLSIFMCILEKGPCKHR